MNLGAIVLMRKKMFKIDINNKLFNKQPFVLAGYIQNGNLMTLLRLIPSWCVDGRWSDEWKWLS